MAPYVVDFLHQYFEAITYVCVREGTGFNKEKVVHAGKLLGPAGRDLSFVGVALYYVQFVSYEHQDNVWLSMFFNFANPLLDILEGLLLCYVVN